MRSPARSWSASGRDADPARSLRPPARASRWSPRDSLFLRAGQRVDMKFDAAREIEDTLDWGENLGLDGYDVHRTAGGGSGWTGFSMAFGLVGRLDGFAIPFRLECLPS